ncbi:hypothetical protein DPMN_101008 [Dreissena polymorpha]|uniref:Uncharacterized protein n=1 Tax=Dreissena polymorpha TaxID=45954 RepID=A0A9D4LHY5_DREPO|nr:hypothetical protein DPMN_101008 [Dreissena polymorpha]
MYACVCVCVCVCVCYIKDLPVVRGVTAWQSSVYYDRTGSLAIDGNFGTTDPVCFATQNATGYYLIVELKTTSNLVHVDILFRSDLLPNQDG